MLFRRKKKLMHEFFETLNRKNCKKLKLIVDLKENVFQLIVVFDEIDRIFI